MQLLISNGSIQNPLTLDLSSYIKVSDGEGLDPIDPAFSERVISHSLLKEGGFLALENLKAKELVFPLRLKAASSSAIATLVQQIDQVITSAGATFSWQDDGLSQPTIFDGISGQFDVEYRYREAQQHFLSGKLRLFTQPLGHTASPRVYATASGVGPLLMISPYASGGALAIGASTQAGVAGFGGQQQGASSGVFFWGAPSLAGDAGAQLQISYVGPLANNATAPGTIPTVAVSLLPDALYQPLVTASQLVITGKVGLPSYRTGADAVSGVYIETVVGGGYSFSFPALTPSQIGREPNALWSGSHRMFAIARASQAPGSIQSVSNTLVGTPASATVQAGDWNVYDIGTFTLRPSQAPQQSVQLSVTAGGSGTLDLCAVVMLPDTTTWFFNPTRISASQYGYPPGVAFAAAGASAPYTNTLLLDDVMTEQYIYVGGSQTLAPSPLGSIPSSSRVTQYTRGLMPRPDPKNGLPIIAILGVGQPYVSLVNLAGVPVGGSWANAQTARTLAQVNVLERTRYVLP